MNMSFSRCILLFLLPLWLSIAVEPALAVETIFVKVFVDDEEMAVEKIWQERLRKRVDRASEILSKYVRVRLVVNQFGTWDSSDAVRDFPTALAEFEREAQRGPAQIAIGFSSQFHLRRGRNNLGGIRGPMSPFILVRETAPNVTEPERLEVLVHELGHFFGAAHSERPDSVMRPVLADGRSRSRAFEIDFDPQNARIIQLVGSEITTVGVRRFSDLSARVKREIRDEYTRLARRLPGDPAARRYLEFLDASLREQDRASGDDAAGAKNGPQR